MASLVLHRIQILPLYNVKPSFPVTTTRNIFYQHYQPEKVGTPFIGIPQISALPRYGQLRPVCCSSVLGFQ